MFLWVFSLGSPPWLYTKSQTRSSLGSGRGIKGIIIKKYHLFSIKKASCPGEKCFAEPCSTCSGREGILSIQPLLTHLGHLKKSKLPDWSIASEAHNPGKWAHSKLILSQKAAQYFPIPHLTTQGSKLATVDHSCKNYKTGSLSGVLREA